jgi:hypothetical protein
VTLQEQHRLAMMDIDTPQDHHVPSPPEPAPVWLQRLSLVVLVVFCFYIGGLMVVLPWSPRYWDHSWTSGSA